MHRGFQTHPNARVAKSRRLFSEGSGVKEQLENMTSYKQNSKDKDPLWNDFFSENIVCCYDRLVRGCHTLVAHQLPTSPWCYTSGPNKWLSEGIFSVKVRMNWLFRDAEAKFTSSLSSWAMTHHVKQQLQFQPLRLEFLFWVWFGAAVTYLWVTCHFKLQTLWEQISCC